MQRLDLAHDIAHAMRSALARAELAAGQIERDATTPRARRLAGSVSGAVAELDRLVSEVVTLLDRDGRAPRSEDLRGVLAELRRRHAGALAARGVEWIEPASAEAGVHGDPNLARRASALLLRIGAGCVRGGGRLALRAQGDADGWCLGVELDGAVDPTPAALGELRALASRTHATLDREQREGWLVLRLRFPNPAAACPAS